MKSDNKLPTADYTYVYPEIDVRDVPKTWGFTPDTKIADLVIVLNRLGLTTSAACEGHKNRQEYFPYASFWNENFYNVLTYLADWPEARGSSVKVRSFPTDVNVVKGSMFAVLFDAGNLPKSQKLAQKFSDYLKSRAR